jgi:hypothetical protein
MSSISITLEKFPSESILFDLDCTDNLATEETITGTPTMSYFPVLTGGDALTLGSPLVNTVPIYYEDGQIGKIGGVIQVRISGGTPTNTTTPRLYSVLGTFTTNKGNTLVARMKLSVLTNL